VPLSPTASGESPPGTSLASAVPTRRARPREDVTNSLTVGAAARARRDWPVSWPEGSPERGPTRSAHMSSTDLRSEGGSTGCARTVVTSHACERSAVGRWARGPGQHGIDQSVELTSGGPEASPGGRAPAVLAVWRGGDALMVSFPCEGPRHHRAGTLEEAVPRAAEPSVGGARRRSSEQRAAPLKSQSDAKVSHAAQAGRLKASGHCHLLSATSPRGSRRSRRRGVRQHLRRFPTKLPHRRPWVRPIRLLSRSRPIERDARPLGGLQRTDRCASVTA
jgi:hypothetical protein